MKNLKWGNANVKPFSSHIPKAVRSSWLDDWYWWALMGVGLGVIVWICVKLYQMAQISLWVKSL